MGQYGRLGLWGRGRAKDKAGAADRGRLGVRG